MITYSKSPSTIQVLDPRDDLQALRIWNIAVVHDLLSPSLYCEKVRRDPDMVPALVLGVYAGRELLAWAGAVVRPESRIGYVKMIVVDPRARGLGLGTVLLREVENRLRELGISEIRVGESAPNYLQPGVDERYTSACLFFHRSGYEAFDKARNMLVDLTQHDWSTTEAEKDLRTKGIDVRRAVSEDWIDLSYWLSELWPSWIPEVLETFRNRPVSLHLAFRGTRLAGFSAYDTNNRGTGWFGPMGTDPAEQGIGIGSVLLFRCLSDIRAQGHRFAVIPWVGPTEFYARRSGASVQREFVRFKKIVS